MADVNISKYRASVVRDGSKPASPGFVVSEGQDPVNPPGTNNFVPYTGATANVELGEFGVEAGFVTLDTTPTNIPTDQGAIYWDDTRSTAALIMNGTLQHIGQDSFFYVKNSSGSSIPKGTAVRFAGTNGASGHILIEPFLANGTYPSSYFMGVTSETIANGAFGQVMHFGELTGINTSGFTAGALLYASSTVAGAFQTTAPVAPNNIILVAAAVNSKNNGAIVVRPTLGSNINSDEGVKITSPTTGDLLQLQAGGLWENKTLAQVIGSAYVPSTRTLTINGTAFDLSANRSWIVGDVRTDGSYSNPSWITALAWSKITGTPTTLSGYGITDAVPNSRTITINGVTQDLSANRTFNVGTVTSVGLSSATSGVTIGSTPVTSSGTITLAIATASGSQQGLLSASDWTTFNNKQNALINPVTGTGTTNYLAKFTGSTTVGNSQVFDNGTNVGIGTTSPASLLHVSASYTAPTGGIDANVQLLTSNTSGASVINMLASNSSVSAIHFGDTDDANVGEIAYTHSNNNMLFVTNAGIRMRLDASGNLGLGVTPSTRLHVVGGSTTTGIANAATTVTSRIDLANPAITLGFGYVASDIPMIQSLNNGTNSATALTINPFGGNLLVGTTSDNGARLQVSGRINATGGGSNGVLVSSNSGSVTIPTTGLSLNTGFNVGYLQNFNGGNYVDLYYGASKHIFDGGNVGIGTSSPGRQLEVYSATLDTRIAITNTTSTSGAAKGFELLLAGSDAYAFNYVNGSMIFGTNSTERMRITSGGDIRINYNPGGSNGLFFNDTTNGAAMFYIIPAVYVGSAPYNSNRILAANSSHITFETGGSERMRILSGGNILIGTTTDVGARLHVNGDFRTAAPTGGSAVNWRLGTVRGGTVTPNATVRVEIGGVLVDLDARYV